MTRTPDEVLKAWDDRINRAGPLPSQTSLIEGLREAIRQRKDRDRSVAVLDDLLKKAYNERDAIQADYATLNTRKNELVQACDALQAEAAKLRKAITNALNPGCGCMPVCRCSRVPEDIADGLQDALDSTREGN